MHPLSIVRIHPPSTRAPRTLLVMLVQMRPMTCNGECESESESESEGESESGERESRWLRMAARDRLAQGDPSESSESSEGSR